MTNGQHSPERSNRNDFRVLLIGCGGLGSRHLQAVASIPGVANIQVVDQSPESLSLGRQRVEEIGDQRSSAQIEWFSSLKEASSGGDLCIVATQAEGRCQLVREIVDQLKFSSFLLEKIVGQSVWEIEELLQFTQKNHVGVWVNCQARAFEFHQRAKSMLDPKEPVTLNFVGGNNGLVTAGIHRADLFAFYDGSGYINGGGHRIDPVLHPSKRGNQLFDLSGTLLGFTDKGSTMTLSYSPKHQNYEHMSISGGGYRCIVDHMQQWAFESDAQSGWDWRPAQYQSEILVSETSRVYAGEILIEGSCSLPTLEESLPAHRFILGELKPHFSRLLNKEIDFCPVT